MILFRPNNVKTIAFIKPNNDPGMLSVITNIWGIGGIQGGSDPGFYTRQGP